MQALLAVLESLASSELNPSTSDCHFSCWCVLTKGSIWRVAPNHCDFSFSIACQPMVVSLVPHGDISSLIKICQVEETPQYFLLAWFCTNSDWHCLRHWSQSHVISLSGKTAQWAGQQAVTALSFCSRALVLNSYTSLICYHWSH